jgi:hypothetical protein
MHRFRSHLTFANVVSLIALFVALGGTAAASVIISSNSQVAQNTISGHKPPSGDHPNLIAGSVNGQDLAAGSVAAAKLGNSAVTTFKLGPSAVTSAKVADGSLTASDVDTSSIQQRISDACPAGNAISQVAESGAATCVSSITNSTNATHATSADSATNADNAANAAALGGMGQASFGSGILGGTLTAPLAGDGGNNFFPIGLTTGALSTNAHLVMPVSATVRDIHVLLSAPAPSGGGLLVEFRNVTTGAERICTINSGDTTCDTFTDLNGTFGSFSAGDEMGGAVINNSANAYNGVVSFSYRLTN